ncbi:symmetrical bis(5'-nucleosyl)-tetraphosphatase [Marinimicrobium alkaliphilum]|uniref:symmetrical bis(5'-nucleosyl)-tetraphosphatase n=1 Tax=Marinimicrobium alkaliphilum TaxID=2202654 RepID=UPI000DB9F74F|nr:symmetrical bis(5'-nucleosyl)-tetraphosphatase [Marinimicrobium alkaliphilum]
MSTYAVGDIQGCYLPLTKLLDKVRFDPSVDTLWVAGDLINRGPGSLDTLRLLMELGESVVAVHGNHDLHFLAVAYGFKKPNRKDTLTEILDAPERDDILHWLRQLKLVHHDPELQYTMVHAGIPPQWDLAQALARAAEVEAVIRGDQLEGFLAAMYGNNPAIWSDDLTGNDRLRVITNYFTRMRFCSAEGHLDLETKTAPGKHPQGYKPWFAHANHRCRDQRILFGHWAALEGRTDASNVVALDTGCVWGGELTALRLDDGERFACRCRGLVG